MVAFNLIVFFHALMLTVLIVAMSKERLELEQRTKAQTDPLTGALNRRAFMARGVRLAQRHRHQTAPLCLLFLDLDHFKSLNDRFGHSGGDDVLMTFVAVVHDNIRPTDFLFRIGGEEFCCLLPHTRADQAHTVAERIRHQFESATVDVAGTPVKATVSLGIASTEVFGYDLDALMRRADMAVYAAKRQGRAEPRRRCATFCGGRWPLPGGRNGADGVGHRHAHHHLRHQELRHHEEGARLARQGGRRLRLPRLQDRRYRPRAAGALGARRSVGRRCSTAPAPPSASCPTRTSRLSDAKKAIALMLEQPSMIKRPVLDLGGGKLLVGFKPETYAAAVASR